VIRRDDQHAVGAQQASLFDLLFLRLQDALLRGTVPGLTAPGWAIRATLPSALSSASITVLASRRTPQ